MSSRFSKRLIVYDLFFLNLMYGKAQDQKRLCPIIISWERRGRPRRVALALMFLIISYGQTNVLYLLNIEFENLRT